MIMIEKPEINKQGVGKVNPKSMVKNANSFDRFGLPSFAKVYARNSTKIASEFSSIRLSENLHMSSNLVYLLNGETSNFFRKN